MGRLSTALYESFNLVDDFQDEILDSLEETGALEEEPIVNESLVNESIWDRVAPDLGIGREEGLEESLHINESNENLSQILDQFYDLMIKQDLGPIEAKKRILQDVNMNESLQEQKQPELSRSERRAKRKTDYMESICEEFRKAADFGLNEELTEEKLKYEGWRIQNLAIRKGVPSADIKEALLKGIK